MAGPRRRRGARMRPHHPAFFESDERSGPATLCEVSYSGARLAVDEPRPAVGESVRIYVWPANHAEPFELAGRVVGVREDGFAVEYEEPGQAICQWIDTLQGAQAGARAALAERPGAES